MPAYEILAVGPNPRPWKTQQGNDLLTYKLTLKDPTGAELTQVENNRKPSSPAPQVGETIEGEIETRTIDTKNGPMQVRKFKAAQKGGFGGGFRPRDPKEVAAIQRQHSQGLAVRVAAAAGWLKDFNPHEPMGKGVLNDLSRLADWFQRDIERGVRLSQQPGYGQEPRVREQERTGQTDVPADPESFTHPRTSAEGTAWAA